jgi:HEAT repeat protein
MLRICSLAFGLASLVACIGCGAAAIPTEQPPATPTSQLAASPPKPKNDIPPAVARHDDFPSVEAAFLEVQRALAEDEGPEQNKALIRCQNWLVMQQEKAIPEAARRATDPQQPLPMQITACRILGMLGPESAEPLARVARSGESTQLRRKAIEMLARQKPPTDATIAVLLELLDDSESQVQWQAAQAFSQIGEPGKAAAARLGELRRDHPEEQVRVAAGDALKKVDPRRTFED